MQQHSIGRQPNYSMSDCNHKQMHIRSITKPRPLTPPDQTWIRGSLSSAAFSSQALLLMLSFPPPLPTVDLRFRARALLLRARVSAPCPHTTPFRGARFEFIILGAGVRVSGFGSNKQNIREQRHHARFSTRPKQTRYLARHP